MSDKKIKKTKAKINGFDVFVMLLVLCLIATVVYKVYSSVASDSNTENSNVTVKFKCDGEYDSIVDYLTDGDVVYLESGEILGYISKNPDRNELFEVIYKSDEEDIEESSSEEETKSIIYESVEFSGEMKLNGNAAKSARGSYYVIGEDNITVGGKLLVHTKSCEFTITVTDILQDFS